MWLKVTMGRKGTEEKNERLHAEVIGSHSDVIYMAVKLGGGEGAG